MKFNSDTAKIKYNAGMSKQALEDGFERVADGADPFAYANRNPRTQGWRDAPPPVLDDIEVDD